MSNLFPFGVGYGLGRAAGSAIFGDGERSGGGAEKGPIVQQTEAQILAAEKRYDEDARRLDAEDQAAKAAKKAGG